MTTEKDAMALAVLTENAADIGRCAAIFRESHMAAAFTLTADQMEKSSAEISEARAHLAARLGELEAQLEASIAMTGENLRRATRAEAEIAALKPNAERYVWLRTPDRGHRLPHVHFKMQDDPSGECFLTFGDCLDAVIDAARGGGDGRG